MLPRKLTLPAVILAVSGLVAACPAQAGAATFLRGDTDTSGTLEISDAVQIFGYLFLESPSMLPCEDAADADDSGAIQITDGIFLLNYLFLGGEAIPPPRETCGPDATEDALGCNSMPFCESADVVRSDLEREESPELAEGELEALVGGSTAFALDLYQELRHADGNIFFSPHSISEALAMAYAGARGETARQMAGALHFTLAEAGLHRAVNALDLELASRGRGAAGHAGGGFQLRVVNATWGQTGYSFLPAFLDVLALNYGAGLRLLDFMADPDGSRETINGWVSDQTEGKVPDLLPQGSVAPTTRMVLTNAVYFSAAWEHPFPLQLTRDDSFHRLDGTSVTAPMMSERADFRYAARPGHQAVELPYDGEELSMVILLPDEGKFTEFEASLNPGLLEATLDSLQPTDVQITLPRFSCTSSFNLNDKLSALGMRDAFSPGAADFSGIDGTRDLYISGVLHKAFVAVDEAGTEAAAATGVVIGIVSVPLDVRVDRPFLFLIRDTETGAIVFLGRVVEPGT